MSGQFSLFVHYLWDTEDYLLHTVLYTELVFFLKVQQIQILLPGIISESVYSPTSWSDNSSFYRCALERVSVVYNSFPGTC